MVTQKGRIIDKAGNEFIFDDICVWNVTETIDPVHAKKIDYKKGSPLINLTFYPKVINYNLNTLDWIVTTIKLQGIDFMYVDEFDVILSTKHYQPKTILYSLEKYDDFKTEESVISCSIDLWL